MRLPNWLTWTIVSLVALMAVTNFVAPFFIKTYEPNEVVNGMFAAIVTALIVGRRGGDGNGNGNGRGGGGTGAGGGGGAAP